MRIDLDDYKQSKKVLQIQKKAMQEQVGKSNLEFWFCLICIIIIASGIITLFILFPFNIEKNNINNIYTINNITEVHPTTTQIINPNKTIECLAIRDNEKITYLCPT